MNVAVIGAGPAGLMAAEVLANGGARVTVYDRMPSVGRKFLMAGRGGLNLTHSEPLEDFRQRYAKSEPRLIQALDAFTPNDLRTWSDALGQPTFVGSSGRVFPKAFKSSPLLRAWLARLNAQGVTFAPRHKWLGWRDDQHVTFDTPHGVRDVQTNVTILALGGASWPKLGSDGGWAAILKRKSIKVEPLLAANCGFDVSWSDLFRDRYAGVPLKNIALSFEGLSVRGEAMLTQSGIEGGAVYALSSAIRKRVIGDGAALVHLALRPDISVQDLTRRLDAPRGKQSQSNFLRKAAGLSSVAFGLLQEVSRSNGQNVSDMPNAVLAEFINAVPLRLVGVAPIARAISTAGGISFDEIDTTFMLRKIPGVFVAGEMLDWEAPTGGYLLQACFSTGVAAGRGALAYLGR